MIDGGPTRAQIYRRDDPKTAYELYGSGSAPLGRIFGAGRFDRGITMLLACTRELLAFASSRRTLDGPRPNDRARFTMPCARRPRGGVPITPPYAIDGDLVGGFSARLHLNSEEKWTSSLRCLLEDMRWLLSWHAAG